jgi:hypothetical protein
MARYVRVQNIRHVIGATGELRLKVASADVRLHAIDGGEARVRATFEIPAYSDEVADTIFEKVRLDTQMSSGLLALDEPDGTASLRGVIDRVLRGRSGVDLSVEVELPRAAVVRLETVSGDVTAEGLLGEQRYTTVSGDLFLADTGGNLRVTTVSGDVTVRGEQPLTLQSDAVSGDLSLSVPRLEGLRTHGVSGDVEIEGELAPAGDFRAETVSGDVTVGLVGGATFEVRGISTDVSSELDHRIEGRLDRRRVVVGNGKPTFLFNSMSGDLSIHRPRRVVVSTSGTASAPAPAPTPPLTPDEQLAILQALERGEIDVEEATRRLGGGKADA